MSTHMDDNRHHEAKEATMENDHADTLRTTALVADSSTAPDVEPQLHWRTWLVLFAGCFCCKFASLNAQ